MDYFKHAVAIVVAAVLTLAIYGAYQFPRFTASQAVGSPAGSTFNSAKVAEQVPTVSTSTIVSLYNSDSSDRVITGAEVLLTGGSVSTTTAYTIACATSTNAYNLNSNTNYVLNMTVAGNGTSIYGTTTGNGVAYMASSSPGVMGTSTTSALVTSYANPFARVWAAGTYLNCTSTTAGGSTSNLFNSSVTGFIAFPYRAQ